MKLPTARIRANCRKRGTTRTAPELRERARSENGPTPAERLAASLLEETREILARHPEASFENVWHTLVLLREPPIDRIRRSLIRGRGFAQR